MGGCLSCAGGEKPFEGEYSNTLQPNKKAETVTITASTTSRWPSTEVGSLHPDATYEGSLCTPQEPLETAVWNEKESPLEPATPSAPCMTPETLPLAAPDVAELIRTPAGPLEGSPSATSDASTEAARNKCVSALFDMAVEREAGANDFDIPAVRRATPQRSGGRGEFRAAAAAEMADLPLSKFKSK